MANSNGNAAGTLYVVATPIGNADDISLRARRVLAEVDIVAAEDTRRTGRLLDMLGIRAELLSCHEHNEAKRVPEILQRLQSGGDVALVSDAGTPLVSDPGFRLVTAAIAAGLAVSPVPGCSAAMAALSVAGLPTDRVLFAGFLPASGSKRRARLAELATLPETIVLFESVHRIEAMLEDTCAKMGSDRPAVAARELTKLHETIYRGSVADVLKQVQADAGGRKGEYTLVLAGAPPVTDDAADSELDRVLTVLLGHLGVRQSAEIAVRLLAVNKRQAYQRALQLRESSDDSF